MRRRQVTGPSMGEETVKKYAGLWAHIEPPSSRRLLLAALEAFAAHGFDGATTRDIAGRAGMSPAAVYVHYGSKAELLYEISRTGHDEVWMQVNDAIDGVVDPTEDRKSVV
jgi:AcrR family transcriptional regulator